MRREVDRAIDVAGPRSRADAQPRPIFDALAVSHCSSQLDTERAGEGRLRDTGIRRGMGAGLRDDRARDVWSAERSDERDQEGGEARRNVIGDVVEASRRPAEACVPRGSVADHRIHRVDRPIRARRRRAARDAPECGRDDGVDAVLGERLDDCRGDAGLVERSRIATDARLRTICAAPSSKLTYSVCSPRSHAATVNSPASVDLAVPGAPEISTLLPR